MSAAIAVLLPATIQTVAAHSMRGGMGGGHGGMRMVQRYAHVGKSHLEAAASRLEGVLSLPVLTDTPELN